jgi:hypothetical protein
VKKKKVNQHPPPNNASTRTLRQAQDRQSAPGLTRAVETVEKVPFQKMIFEKWDRNIEKHLVFCVPNNILAIFEPVVGDLCENFSNKRFFDSLVRRLTNMNTNN